LKNLLGRGLAFGLGELDDLVLARLLLLGRRRNTLDETDDAATHVRVLNPPECRYQREPVRRREAVGHVCRRRRFAGRLRAFSLRLRVELDRSAVEEERHRHLQDQRYLLYARRTDAIGALLVFLDLLEAFPATSKASSAACGPSIRRVCRSHSALSFSSRRFSLSPSLSQASSLSPWWRYLLLEQKTAH